MLVMSKTATSTRPRFADELRQARKSRGWTQPDLATHSGISASTIHRAERGEEVSEDTERSLRKALGMPMPGHLVTASPVGALRPGTAPGESVAMGQLVGHMMMHGGGGPDADPFTVLSTLATKRDDPAEVFKALAKARSEAPPAATWEWWIDRYLSALTGKGAKA
jgi:transcriptional regulator with XRE-family HTH domain